MSEQEQQRKHQLIGAVVLVALGLIVVSILLRGPEQESSSLDYSIPKEPEVAVASEQPVVSKEEKLAAEQHIQEQWVAQPKIEPVVDDAEQEHTVSTVTVEQHKAGEEEQPQTPPAEPTPAPAEAVEAPIPSKTEPEKAEVESKPAPATPPATETGVDSVALPQAAQNGWAVQLWSLSNSERAKALVYELRDAGYEAFLIEIAASGKTFYRINAGPVGSKAEAQTLLQTLKKDTTVQVDEGFPVQLSR